MKTLPCTVPVLASRANASALACNVTDAIALYRHVRELDFQFFPGDPQVIVPVLAEQNGDMATSEPASEQPPSPLPSPTVTPRATGTPVVSTPVATPGPIGYGTSGLTMSYGIISRRTM